MRRKSGGLLTYCIRDNVAQLLTCLLAAAGSSCSPAGDVDLAALPCEPIADGVAWIEEGDPLVATVRCPLPGEHEPGHALLTVAPLPRGATFDRATAELRWIPSLDQAGRHQLAVTAADGRRGTLVIDVADRFDAPGNSPIVNPAQYPEEMGLPVFHLTTSAGIDEERYTPAAVVYRGRRYRAEAQYRGQSSREYRKRSYTLKFARSDRFDDPLVAGGFRHKRKLVLVSNFDDNSHLRYRLAYELWRRIGAPGKIAVQTFSAVVYDRGVYQGLYTVTDHIDGDLMEEHGLPAGGNLYKGIAPQANFFRHEPVAWTKKEGVPAEGHPAAFDDLIALRDFVASTPDDVFEREVGARLAVGEYRAWLILASAIQARDTLGKNSFHHHDPSGGPWRVVPWDFNHSFGQDWMTNREPPMVPVPQIAAMNRLFQRLHDHPTLGEQTRAAYRRALAEEIPVAAVIDLLDAFADEISLAVRRDQRRWRLDYLTFGRWSARPDFTDFGGEVAYIRRWIRERWAALARGSAL